MITVNHQAQGAGGGQSGNGFQRQLGRDTQFESEHAIGERRNQRKVAFEGQGAAEQVQVAFASQGHIRAHPSGLARWVGRDDKLAKSHRFDELQRHVVNHLGAK